ncbi:hypothetical protein [Burkholderia ambifaria]|uniref:hypothetical protein n=1 Tax=Burkholderia ambifaria TaxID=152480 RepID=UPI001C931C09|nr:hypothetical protein [Burkholderia ambifaria]MBY4771034.1 hypothetical protein [Burkholderia ambifaria]
MSFIGNIVKSVVGDVTKAAGDVLHGVGNALHGAATFGKGLLSGNPKEALAGAGAIATGGLEALEGGTALAENLTPEGAATALALAGGKEAVRTLTSGTGPA